jgi:hypothetical protein
VFPTVRGTADAMGAAGCTCADDPGERENHATGTGRNACENAGAHAPRRRLASCPCLPNPVDEINHIVDIFFIVLQSSVQCRRAATKIKKSSFGWLIIKRYGVSCSVRLLHLIAESVEHTVRAEDVVQSCATRPQVRTRFGSSAS